tara:strand:- start:18747 stop:19499 length:753 start_codon:yes stop_codon:yes gene_type:complete
MKNSIIVLLFLGTVILSCSNSTSSDETEKISLPLKIGNSWTYNVEVSNYRNNPITKTQETDVIFTVLSDTVVDGIQWFYIESDIQKFNFCLAGYYSNQQDGIYFIRSFESTVQEKKSSEVFTIGNALFDTELATNHEVKVSPFLHNPDNEVPDRLIKNEYTIASVTYKGESINENFNVISQDYVWNYYQQSVGTKTYSINPFDLNFSVSNNLGFLTYESAYVSRLGSTEDDPRLQLLFLYQFKLTDFNEN